MDLHILPSRSEGFPKVILETAAAGIPSVLYSDYGASEWITLGENGYVVNNLSDMITIIESLHSDRNQLQKLSAGAINLAIGFDWKKKINYWEKAIEEICANHGYEPQGAPSLRPSP